MIYIRLGHYEGAQFVTDCEAEPNAYAVLGFTIPADWGGVLQVDFVVIPLDGKHAIGKYETQTSEFRLGGTASGCPLELPRINP